MQFYCRRRPYSAVREQLAALVPQTTLSKSALHLRQVNFHHASTNYRVCQRYEFYGRKKTCFEGDFVVISRVNCCHGKSYVVPVFWWRRMKRRLPRVDPVTISCTVYSLEQIIRLLWHTHMVVVHFRTSSNEALSPGEPSPVDGFWWYCKSPICRASAKAKIINDVIYGTVRYESLKRRTELDVYLFHCDLVPHKLDVLNWTWHTLSFRGLKTVSHKVSRVS